MKYSFQDREVFRRGKCRRCGRCCASRIGECPHFRWIAVEDIPEGAIIDKTGIGTSLVAECLIFDSEETWKNCTPEVRRSFPSTPNQIMGGCGFWFEDGEGRKLVRRIEEGRVKLVFEGE